MKMRSEPKGRFAQFMVKAMQEKGISLRELSATLRVSYQHLNMCMQGERQPSELMLQAICKPLGLDYDEMLARVVRDKMERTHGRAALSAAFDKSPRVADYEAYAPLLTSEQHSTIVTIMKSFAASNRKVAK